MRLREGRIARWGTLFLGLLVASTAAGRAAAGQTADGTEVASVVVHGEAEPPEGLHLDLSSVRVEEVLRRLEAHAQVRLAYSSDLVPMNRRISVRAVGASAGEVLSELAARLGLDLKRTVQGQYVLAPDPDSPVVEERVQGAITGNVTLPDGRPASGASVQIEGTRFGALTDSDGSYRITGVPPGEYVLVVSFIGYRSERRSVTVAEGEATDVDVDLQVSAVSLDQIVVTASGTERLREIGHAVDRLDAAAEVERAQSRSLEDLLTGRFSSVQIQENSGSVGSAANITVRGSGSISLSNRPIVYVDGARVRSDPVEGGVRGQDYSRLTTINPDEIESIEVVKGPAATTLYGTEAAGGVIRIETKAGSSREPSYRFRAEYGQLRDKSEYLASQWNPRSLLGPDAADTVYSMNLLESRSPFRSGDLYTFAGSVSGGTDGFGYYVSGERSREEGFVPTNSVEATKARANFSVRPVDELSIDVSSGLMLGDVRLPEANNSPFGWIALSYLGSPWQERIRHPDPNATGSAEPVATCPLNVEIARMTGTPLSDLGRTGCEAGPGFSGRTFDDLGTIDNRNESERFIGSATVEWSPFESWSNRVTIGYDGFTEQARSLFPVDPERPFGQRSEGELTKRTFVSENLTAEFSSSLSYGLTESLVGRLRSGVQYFREVVEGDTVIAQGFPAGSPSVGNATTETSGDTYAESRTVGLFVEHRFAWNDRLFATPAVRFDDNSAFGEDLGIKTYPRLSLSWVASEEPWFSIGALDQLRLRGAWGQSGKQPGTFNAVGLLAPIPVVRGGDDVLGVQPVRPGNSELRPETSTGLEIGFDAALAGERVDLGFTYFRQTTSDALVQQPLAASSGFLQPRWINLAELRNAGIEVSAGASLVREADFGLDVNLQFSTNESEITELPDPIVIDAQEHREGFPFGAFFGFPVSVADDGEVRIADEERFLGNPEPQWSGSFSTTASFFGEMLSLYAHLDAAGDFVHFRAGERIRCQLLGGGTYGGVCPGVHERDADGDFTDGARVRQAASGEASRVIRSPWIEDATFAKLRTLGLAFELPGSWTSRLLGASSVTLRVTAQNVATWTGYGGLDPELSIGGAVGAGPGAAGDGLDIPPGRRFLGSLSITF